MQQLLEQLHNTCKPIINKKRLTCDTNDHDRYTITNTNYKRVLVTNIPFLITCDANDKITILQNHSIVIEGDTINSVLPSEQVKQEGFDVLYDAGKRGGIVVTPGLINTHAHIHMYLMRSAMLLDEGESIDETIAAMARWGAHETDESMAIAALGDITEQQKYGITTTLTHGPSFEIAENAARLTGQHIINAVSAISNSRPTNTPEAVGTLATHQETYTSRLALAIHYLYKADIDVLQKIRRIADEYNLLTTFHAAESPFVVAQTIEKHGMREVALMKQAGFLNNKSLISHVLHVEKNEINQLASAGVGISHLPTSNVIHKSGLFKFWEFEEHGGFPYISLGTDGVVSKNRLDLLTEAYQARVSHLYNRTIKFGSLFKMLTTNGARVAGEEKRGRIIPGAKADIVFWKLMDRGFIPYDTNNPATILGNLITHGGRTVRDVMINGKFIIKDRRHVLIDESGLLRATQDAHMALRKRVTT